MRFGKVATQLLNSPGNTSQVCLVVCREDMEIVVRQELW